MNHEKKTFIFLESDFDSEGVFIREEFLNIDFNRYEFDGNVKIKVKKSIFEHSIVVKGNNYVEGANYVEGYNTVEGDNTVKGTNTVEGDNYVKGDNTVKGYELLNPRGSITINHIGSRNSHTIFYFTKENGIMVRCGCRFVEITKFREMVIEKHGENQYANEYLVAIEYAEKMYKYYKSLNKE